MSDIQELEKGIADAKELVKNRDMAIKLSENHEFRKLFIEGFFKIEAARLVQLSSDPALSLEQRADALSMAQATGHTKRFLSMMIQMGNAAANQIPDLESELEEARREELAD